MNTALVEVSLPASVTNIGEYAFGRTPTITKIVSLNTTPPKTQSSTFDIEVEEKAMLHVPKGSLVHYWLDPVWKEFGNMSDDILCLDVIPDATYDDPEIDLSQFAPEGVELVYETSNSDVIEINGTMMRIVGAGEATVGAMLADGDSQMQLMGQMRQFKVNKADLEVTVVDITIAQGQALPEFSYVVEGLVYDDTVDDIETMPQPICDVTENSAPGEYAVEFTEGSDRNYEITTKPAKVTVIAPTVLELDALPATKYGDEAIDLNQYAPEDYGLEYESPDNNVVEIDGATMRIVGAGKATVITKVPAEYSNVRIDNPLREIIVGKADLSVTVADITIAQGQPLPDFSYIVSGFVNGDTEDDIETMPQPVCDVTEYSAPGEYAVEFTEGSDSNYEITTKSAKVTVTAVEPPVSNIDDIDANNDTEIEVYDMKGIGLYKGPRSEARLAKGFYLVRQGAVVAKVYVE